MDENKRMLEGVVISDSMDKTIVVKVERVTRHPRLEKVLHTFKKFKVHDEANLAKVGDKVEFYETRPISKTKYMCLNRVLSAN